MPHASLLGSNGHHCAFTSEMISGHINVFIVRKGCVAGGRKGTEITYTCMYTSFCAHRAPSLRCRTKITHRLFAHTVQSFAPSARAGGGERQTT